MPVGLADTDSLCNIFIDSDMIVFWQQRIVDACLGELQQRYTVLERIEMSISKLRLCVY
jgi:hypothetical protein